MTADDVLKWFGLVGGLTGPPGLWIAYATYRRDAANLRVSLRRGVKITHGPAGDALIRDQLALFNYRGQDPPMTLFTRDPDKDWAILELRNLGRRSIRVTKIGWTIKRGKHIVPGGYLDGTFLPAVIGEGDGRDFPIEESQLADALCVWAQDTAGRSYYGGFAATWRGRFARLRTKLGLPAV